jgi:hypothetical protein
MHIQSIDKARDMARRRHSVDSYVESIVDRAAELEAAHIARIVAAGPAPSDWPPEHAATLQRLFGPLIRAAAREMETEAS